MADVEKLLIVGSGGREFALIDEAIRSGVSNVYSTRGENAVNIGIEGVVNTGLGEDPNEIASWAQLEEMDLVIVGTEKPLVNGIGELIRSRGVPVFGPNSDGAVFEADKTITHDFVSRHGLPNPNDSETYSPDQVDGAKDHIRELGVERIVTKRVGMEGGKGVRTYESHELDDALNEVDAVAEKNEKLLIQGRLLGPEYSATFMLDGRGNVVATALSRDHKSLYEDGVGPMTGGMGAFAPLSLDQANLERRSDIEEIGLQIAEGLVEDGIDYRGALYAGLMAETEDPNSRLRILEFNVRFGDPETQVLLHSLGDKAIEYMYSAAQGSLDMDLNRLYSIAGQELVSMTVCLASPGYAEGDIVTGLPIHVPDDLPSDVSIQFAGAKMKDRKPVSTGGRVAYITKTAPISEVRSVYEHIGRENRGIYIGDNEQVIRNDIGRIGM